MNWSPDRDEKSGNCGLVGCVEEVGPWGHVIGVYIFSLLSRTLSLLPDVMSWADFLCHTLLPSCVASSEPHGRESALCDWDLWHCGPPDKLLFLSGPLVSSKKAEENSYLDFKNGYLNILFQCYYKWNLIIIVFQILFCWCVEIQLTLYFEVF